MNTIPDTKSINFNDVSSIVNTQNNLIYDIYSSQTKMFKKSIVKRLSEMIIMSNNTIKSLIPQKNLTQESITYIYELLNKNQEVIKLAERISTLKKSIHEDGAIEAVNDFQNQFNTINKNYFSQNMQNTQGDNDWAMSPVHINSIQHQESFKIPTSIRVLDTIKSIFNSSISFVFKNTGAIALIAFIGFFVWIIADSIYESIKESKENLVMEKMADTPKQIHEMLSKEYFNQKTFRNYVIFLERANKEKHEKDQWNIKFNDIQRFMIISKNDISQSQCRSMVALKEISWDSAIMKVNNISAPVNYWTANDSPEWKQKVNSNLCSLKSNNIELTMTSNGVKSHVAYMRNLENKNIQFFINQHKLASHPYYSSSTIVKKALEDKVVELNHMFK